MLYHDEIEQLIHAETMHGDDARRPAWAAAYALARMASEIGRCAAALEVLGHAAPDVQLLADAVRDSVREVSDALDKVAAAITSTGPDRRRPPC